MKMKVTIEKQKDGTYIAYNTEESNSSLIGTGSTVSEAKDDFFNSVQEVIETLESMGEAVPEHLLKEPEFSLKPSPPFFLQTPC